MEQPKNILGSLSNNFRALQNYEKKYDNFLDPPTSGESSPCISDTERQARIVVPNAKEVANLLTDEAFLEVTTDIEALKNMQK